MSFLDMSNRQLEDELDQVNKRIRELNNRLTEHYRELAEDRQYNREREQQIIAAIRRVQAALNLPQLTDED